MKPDPDDRSLIDDLLELGEQFRAEGELLRKAAAAAHAGLVAARTLERTYNGVQKLKARADELATKARRFARLAHLDQR